MTGQIPATGLSGHCFLKILPVGLQNGACQPVVFSAVEFAFLLSIFPGFFPSRCSRLLFQAAVPVHYSMPLVEAISPGRCSRPLFQAAVPGHNSRPLFQDISSGRCSRPLVQAALPDRYYMYPFQAGFWPLSLAQYSGICFISCSRPLFQADVTGRCSWPRAGLLQAAV